MLKGKFNDINRVQKDQEVYHIVLKEGFNRPKMGMSLFVMNYSYKKSDVWHPMTACPQCLFCGMSMACTGLLCPLIPRKKTHSAQVRPSPLRAVESHTRGSHSFFSPHNFAAE